MSVDRQGFDALMRRAHFATQRDLASRARIGEPKLAMILRGTRPASLQEAYRLASALDVSIDALGNVLGAREGA